MWEWYCRPGTDSKHPTHPSAPVSMKSGSEAAASLHLGAVNVKAQELHELEGACGTSGVPRIRLWRKARDTLRRAPPEMDERQSSGRAANALGWCRLPSEGPGPALWLEAQTLRANGPRPPLISLLNDRTSLPACLIREAAAIVIDPRYPSNSQAKESGSHERATPECKAGRLPMGSVASCTSG